MTLFIAALLSVAVSTAAAQVGNSSQIAAAVQYADATWNCLDVKCKEHVKPGDAQPVFGCAPFVSHCLAAGGWVNGKTPEDSVDSFGDVKYKGTDYNLNCCGSKDSNPSCGGSPGLADYLLARGWTKTDKVVAGTACFVVGSDGPFSHAVFGVGDDLVDAHNNAAYHVKFSSTYTADLLLNPPANE